MKQYTYRGILIATNLEKTNDELDVLIELVSNLRIVNKEPKSFSFEVYESNGNIDITF